jgi:hypothetical protein
MENNSPEQIKAITDFLLSLKGAFFNVTFIKRTNGELRTMTARTGVKKWVKGVGLSFNPKSKNLLGVHVQNEADKKEDGAYRFVNLETVMEIRSGGKVLVVSDL